jgi:precorrin-3B synthase
MPDETGDVAARLAGAFLGLAGAGAAAPRRMRALVRQAGAAAVFKVAGSEATPRARWQRRALLRNILGTHLYGAAVIVGATAAFGEIEAVRFAALIEHARTFGANSLRLTPWRAFLIVGLDPRGAESMVASIDKLGFIVDADEPCLRVAACPGAPACAHGARPVRDDATYWAQMLPKGDGVILHVSGCAKGCARSAATAATFTATEAGYDLILDGRAGDFPAWSGLSSAEVTQLLASESPRMFARKRRS